MTFISRNQNGRRWNLSASSSRLSCGRLMTNCQSCFPGRSTSAGSWVISHRRRLMLSVVSCPPSRIRNPSMLRNRRLSMLSANRRPVRLLLHHPLRMSSLQRLWLLSGCCLCQTWSLRVCLVVIHQLLVYRRAEVLGWFPQIPLRQILTTSPGTQFSVHFFDYPESFQHRTLLRHPQSSILS